MKRFIEGVSRDQGGLFPALLDDFIDEDNPVRVIDAFVDMLDLRTLGFAAVDPSATGRPGYHPSVLLKLYIYGYLNRIPSSRRLEREAGRNIELMWLTERLAPDHKTIADFRKDYGSAIQRVCAQFTVLCRDLNLFKHGSVAIDGSKFKAVNSRDNNFTQTKISKRIEQAETHIKRYLTALERLDRQGDGIAETRTTHLKEKIEKLRKRIENLHEMDKQVAAAPDKQISLTDPDARAMATAGNGTNVVGYNVQIAVDTEHHLILAHEVSNIGSDRTYLSPMGQAVLQASGCKEIKVFADRGYYSRDEIHACKGTGVTPYIPKSETSGAFKQGRFAIQDFRYDATHNHYICPAGKHLTKGKVRSDRRPNAETDHYRNLTACGDCPLKSRCTSDKVKRVKRWIYEEVLDEMQERLEQMPNAMKIRRQTAEHPFGTIKAWMGTTHCLTKTLQNVKTEISLQVLAYNLKRMISIFGVTQLIRKMMA